MEVTGRRERRRKQLLDDIKETRGYWELEEEALDCTLRRTCFGRGCESDYGMNSIFDRRHVGNRTVW
jgi:hypothetical protein